MTTPDVPLSGHQFQLNKGPYAATIASIGASLRCLRYKDRNLIVPFHEQEVRPAYRGAVLVPWPNRIVNGRYRFNDTPNQLALNEPERGHALHGLAAWQDWSMTEKTTSSVTLQTQIPAQKGYPFRLCVRARYTLTDAGLHTQIKAINTSRESAPYGAAAHPYLVAGAGKLDQWALELPGREILLVTDQRLIPTALAPVGEYPEYDFRKPATIGPVSIDHAYTGLIPDKYGKTTIRLTAADGAGVAMTWDPTCPWVQIHTADLPDQKTTRQGLAVEPMTCPPDAFNSGKDLTILAPGQSHVTGWIISAIEGSTTPRPLAAPSSP